MLNKKVILTLVSILVVAALGGGTYYYFNKFSEQGYGDKQALNDEAILNQIENLDLSESGLDSADLPEINMALGFDDAMNLEAGDSALLDVPKVDLDAPDVPAMEPFVFNSGGLEDAFVSQSSASAQSDQESQASQQAAQEAADQAATDAAQEAEAEAKAEAGAPADIEETSAPEQTGPSASDCAQFDSAPSCDYVPADVRDICEQCKG